jgi:hypothetical protein
MENDTPSLEEVRDELSTIDWVAFRLRQTGRMEEAGMLASARSTITRFLDEVEDQLSEK